MKNHILSLTVIILFASCTPKFKSLPKNAFVNSYKFNSEIYQTLSSDSLEPDYQRAAVDFSAKGDYKNALLEWDNIPMFKPKTVTYSTKEIDSIKNKYRVSDAKEYIINKSVEHKIIIVNEFHHNGTHRAFTESLLKDLYKNGYRNLCLEALNHGKHEDTLLNERKYPIQSSGYYIKNPQFGSLVRTALNIGYKVFPYETTQLVGGETREKDQANNMAKIIRDNPNEKFIIQCGSGHALEGKVSFYGGLALAERLKQLTGMDPLTIDQVYYTERSKLEYRSPIFKSFNIEKPSVLLDANNSPFKYSSRDSWMDVVVFHPDTKYVHDRPNWLIQHNKKFVEIELDNIDLVFPVMVFAFIKTEDYKNAIPIDMLEVKDKTTECYLSLKKGNYNIIIVNQSGEGLIFEKQVK